MQCAVFNDTYFLTFVVLVSSLSIDLCARGVPVKYSSNQTHIIQHAITRIAICWDSVFLVDQSVGSQASIFVKYLVDESNQSFRWVLQ